MVEQLFHYMDNVYTFSFPISNNFAANEAVNIYMQHIKIRNRKIKGRDKI